MIQVFAEQDRVVLAFDKRGQDLQLAPDQAEGLAAEMERHADFCETWVNVGGSSQLLRGGTRGAAVKSWDGFVNVRFDSITDREEVPYKAARLLAAQIRAKVPEARARLTIIWKLRFTRV
jgi:hypothetical protein